MEISISNVMFVYDASGAVSNVRINYYDKTSSKVTGDVLVSYADYLADSSTEGLKTLVLSITSQFT